MKRQPIIVATLVLLATFAFAWLRLSQNRQNPAAVTTPYPLHMAAVWYPETIHGLVSSGVSVNALDDNGVTPLWYAAMHRRHAGVAELLSHHADANIVFDGQESPLTIAAMWGNLDTVRLLVDHGADVNAQYMSRTALHEAIAYGHDDIVELLLDHPDIDCNQRQTGTGYTPLHTAVQHERRDIITALLGIGADPSITDVAGNTPHDLAVHKTDISIAACFANRPD